jgi:hypothetical protein
MLADLDASFRKALTESSVSIGPFTFGGTTSRLTTDTPSGRVSVTDLSRQPQIVAVISTILPAGSGL